MAILKNHRKIHPAPRPDRAATTKTYKKMITVQQSQSQPMSDATRRELRRVNKKIQYFCDCLDSCENNRQYITACRGLRRWLERFYQLIQGHCSDPEFKVDDQRYFGGWFPLATRIDNSILDYEYGNRPF